MRALIIPALSGLLLAACDQLISNDESPVEAETPPANVVEVEVEAEPVQADLDVEPAAPASTLERKRATIDWNQARADYAARDTEDDGMAQVASGSSIAVPVLLPDTPVSVASTGDGGLQFRPLADGYFAVKEGEIYDMIINGTDRLIARPEDTGASSDTELRFEETITGAQVSFSRYGASYLVEFMCNDPATAAKGSCVNERTP